MRTLLRPGRRALRRIAADLEIRRGAVFTREQGTKLREYWSILPPSLVNCLEPMRPFARGRTFGHLNLELEVTEPWVNLAL